MRSGVAFFFTATCLTCCVILGCASNLSVQETRIRAESYYARGYYSQAYDELFPLAKRGDPQAQYTISYMYYYGQGVARDEAIARKWMRKSAEQGNPRAKYALQLMLENGYPRSVNHPLLNGDPRLSAITGTPSIASAGDSDINWIRQQNPTEYTLVLTQTAEAKRLASLLQKEGLTNNRISTYRYLKNGRVQQGLAYGTYSSRDSADLSKKNLDKELQAAVKLSQWETVQNVMLP